MRKTVAITIAVALLLAIAALMKAWPSYAAGGNIAPQATAAASATATTAPLTRFQQTNARIAYTGTWQTFAKSTASGGSYGRSSSSNASATATFDGTYLAWITTAGTTLSKAYVSVDGGPAVRVDLARSAVADKQHVWDTGTLSYGRHKVKIWRDTTDAAGKYISVDAFDIRGTLVTAGSTTTTTTRPATTTTTKAPPPTSVPPTTASTVRPTTTTTAGSTIPTTRVAAGLSVTSFGAKGDGIADDTAAIQKAISAAGSGDTVSFPEGTYKITSTIRPKSNLTLSGTAGKSVLTMPAQSSLTYMMYAENLSGLTLTGLSFKAAGYTANVNGFYLPGAQNSRAEHLYLQGLANGIKLGSGNVASGWVMNDIVVRSTEMPMYVSYVHNSTFTGLDLQAVKTTNTLYHAIYISEENRGLTFNGCTFTGGSGYSLQLWLESGSSSDLTFNTLVVDATAGRYPIVIGPGFSNVALNTTQITGPAAGELIRFYGGANITFDGFTASGGSELVGVNGTVSNVVLKNGTYTGTNLGTGVSFQSVTHK